MDTTAAAPPPTPLNAATIWGIAVIFTRRAAGTPMATPMAIAPTMSGMWPSPLRAKVAPMAIAIPAAPTRFPARARLGELRPFSARMKPTTAAR
jgi:hypothetical protein